MDKTNGLDAISDFIFVSKYARFNEKLKRRETLSECVDRVQNMHLKKYSLLSDEDKAEVKWAFDKVKDKLVVPSMRSMQYGGKAIETNNQKMFNCGVRHIDSIRAFSESLYGLLCGNGIGFGLNNKFLGRLPDLVDKNDKTGTIITYVVEDHIAGWSDSIEALMMCYFKNTALSGRKIVFDYSRIRRKGARLVTSGGRAPGYSGLKNCHQKIKHLLDNIIEENGQKRLKTINAYDILMHCADAVLSGGSRRSACCIIFDLDDEDMMKSKTGDWFKENPQRARSNNSFRLIRGKTSFEDFKKHIQNTKEWGEPGFVFVNEDAQDSLQNPCIPNWSKLLTINGIKELKDVNIGDKIWSKDGWTTVINKWSTGIKKIYEYRTESECSFYGTKNHKVVENGIKTEVDDAYGIDCFISGSTGEHEETRTHFSKIKHRSFVSEEEVFDITVDNNSHTFWCNGADISNCFEISFIPITDDGRCGFSFCNLSEINGGKITNKEIFQEAVKAATIIGTLQAGYTNFSYLGHTSEELTKQEALLGVSITGYFDNPEILFNPELQKEMAKLAVSINEDWSKKIKINPAARITCTKPSGTASLLLKTASGIHPHHDHKYIRRVQCNKLDHVYQFFNLYNSDLCEEGIWSANKTDDVISFPLEINEKSVVKSQLTAIQHLDYVKLTQKNWVEYGTSKYNKKPIKHSVSCTVLVKQDEWEVVTEYLYKNQEFFTAVSLLPDDGDKKYKQAPLEKITTEKEEKHFQNLKSKLVNVDYTKLTENSDDTHLVQEAACAGGKCEIL